MTAACTALMPAMRQELLNETICDGHPIALPEACCDHAAVHHNFESADATRARGAPGRHTPEVCKGYEEGKVWRCPLKTSIARENKASTMSTVLQFKVGNVLISRSLAFQMLNRLFGRPELPPELVRARQLRRAGLVLSSGLVASSAVLMFLRSEELHVPEGTLAPLLSAGGAAALLAHRGEAQQNTD